MRTCHKLTSTITDILSSLTPILILTPFLIVALLIFVLPLKNASAAELAVLEPYPVSWRDVSLNTDADAARRVVVRWRRRVNERVMAGGGQA